MGGSEYTSGSSLLSLRTPKQKWIVFHARDMTAVLQLCYHKRRKQVRLEILELGTPK
jgi:hypothetical protein